MTVTNQVRWGLLSTARINRRVIPAIRQSENSQLVAVASRTRESAESYANQWEIPHFFDSYEAMLQSSIVDAVYIALPNHLHAEWTIKCLEAGKHVLCEKPFALTLAEVDAVRETSLRTGSLVAEAFMYRHHPQAKILGEWVHSGRLGDILYVWGVFNFKLDDPHGKNVRSVANWGGGSLWDVGVYPMSMAQYVMQSAPESVFATQLIGPNGIDVSFAGHMVYSNGRMAQFSSGFSSPYHTRLQIIGSKGTIEIERPFNGIADAPNGMVFTDMNGDRTTISVPEEYLYLGEVEDMNRAILQGSALYLTLDETRKHIQTALALYQSAETGQVVKLLEITS